MFLGHQGPERRTSLTPALGYEVKIQPCNFDRLTFQNRLFDHACQDRLSPKLEAFSPQGHMLVRLYASASLQIAAIGTARAKETY